MLEFSDVSKAFNGTTVVHPLNLSIEAGEKVVLLGPSGCGKTTILRMVAGLVSPTSGQITVDSLPLNSQTIGAVRRKLGYVIQEGGLFPHLTGLENVTLMARHEGWPRNRIDDRLAELVEMTQFPQNGLSRYPNELSGGQRQRLSLMRALFLSPRILLLDEPLGALDPLIRAGLQRDLNQVFARSRCDRAAGDARPGRGEPICRSRVCDECRTHRAAGPFRRDSRKTQRRVRSRIHQFAGCRLVKNRSLVKLIAIVLVLLIAGLAPIPRRAAQIRIGSKKFTESVILGEMLRLLAEEAKLDVVHYREFGGTRIVFDSLVAGEIDVYPEYTGTITAEIFAGQNVRDETTMRDLLREKGIGISKSLGFSNTYALALTRKRAAELGISRISDLKRLPELRLALTHEFLDRADGWPALKRRYDLQQSDVVGVDHDVAYRQLLGRRNRHHRRVLDRRHDPPRRSRVARGRPVVLSPLRRRLALPTRLGVTLSGHHDRHAPGGRRPVRIRRCSRSTTKSKPAT